MSYKILFDRHHTLKKTLQKLSSDNRERIFFALESLSQDPFARQQPTKLLQPKSKKIYRLRVGNYRVIYSLDTANKIMIVHQVGLRRDVYKS
jgi:mRNA interferase RelE/StbE